MIEIGAGGHGGSGKAADLQARYNEVASIVARHTTSSSPSTFRRLVRSSSLDKRSSAHPTIAALTTARQVKQTRHANRRQNTESLNSNESSNDSLTDDDYNYDYDDTDDSDHRPRPPIEPILTAASIGATAGGASIHQPFQIRSSVHLEHRLGPLTSHYSPNSVNNANAPTCVCCIL